MRPDEPYWWYGSAEEQLMARLLKPAGDIYGAIAVARYRRHDPYRSRLPVICVGNFTAGGTGKTPLTRVVLDHLAAIGASPVCLTRGYGGALTGPVWVDPARHTPGDVGDEPLLLAARSRVLVARDRAAGARMIEQSDPAASVIVMDDGLQNPSLAKDLSIAVIDAARGTGNGRVIPAGPLRAPLEFQLGLVDCIVVNGDDPSPEAGVVPIFDLLKRSFPGPVLRAEPQPVGDVAALKGARVVAYAAIANPGRFFRLLERIGAIVEVKMPFADHHPFTDQDAEAILAAARSANASLITTEKDKARLAGATGACAKLASDSNTLPIRTVFAERDRVRLTSLIEAEIKLRR